MDFKTVVEFVRRLLVLIYMLTMSLPVLHNARFQSEKRGYLCPPECITISNAIELENDGKDIAIRTLPVGMALGTMLQIIRFKKMLELDVPKIMKFLGGACTLSIFTSATGLGLTFEYPESRDAIMHYVSTGIAFVPLIAYAFIDYFGIAIPLWRLNSLVKPTSKARILLGTILITLTAILSGFALEGLLDENEAEALTEDYTYWYFKLSSIQYMGYHTILMYIALALSQNLEKKPLAPVTDLAQENQIRPQNLEDDQPEDTGCTSQENSDVVKLSF